MALWDYDNPPVFKNPKGKECVRTERGWEDPDTGEVLVAISNLATKGGASLISSVSFGAAEYAQGEPISVIVHFVEKVDVTAGASIEVSFDGTGGNFTLQAAAQDGVFDVVFDKQVDNETPATVPAEAGTLSIAAQSLIGTIVDDLGAAAAELAISASQAAAAGTRVVAEVEEE